MLPYVDTMRLLSREPREAPRSFESGHAHPNPRRSGNRRYRPDVAPHTDHRSPQHVLREPRPASEPLAERTARIQHRIHLAPQHQRGLGELVMHGPRVYRVTDDEHVDITVPPRRSRRERTEHASEVNTFDVLQRFTHDGDWIRESPTIVRNAPPLTLLDFSAQTRADAAMTIRSIPRHVVDVRPGVQRVDPYGAPVRG
jgi:hypothetical protein